jgi:hypothetical protein
MRRRYYLHKRKGIFYAELISSAGVKLSARSTKTANRDEAMLVIADWFKNGLPVVEPPVLQSVASGQAEKQRPLDVAANL